MGKLYEVTYANENGTSRTIYVYDRGGTPYDLIMKANTLLQAGWRIAGFSEVATAICDSELIGQLYNNQSYILI